MNFFIATVRAGQLFGVHGGRAPREVEVTHDFHLSAVYLLIRAMEPVAADAWCFEEEIRAERGRLNEKLPDAIIAIGAYRRVVEFGGAYGKKKLEAFHNYCAGNDLDYEVW